MMNRNFNPYNSTDRMAGYIYLFFLLAIAATAIYKFTTIF